jgi:hypothetical protein
MNRRSFFKFLGAGAATLALSEAIPFGRVWSFPSKIVVPQIGNHFLTHDQVLAETVRIWKSKLVVAEMLNDEWERDFGKSVRVGHIVRIRKPPVFQPYVSAPIVEYDQYVVTSVHPPRLVPA